ncbi:hypothetical protein HDU86_004645 [Geranomyces michiganensis]|nr:hypothetical protein HDU86_004645 [Geranomyces michiganensis]
MILSTFTYLLFLAPLASLANPVLPKTVAPAPKPLLVAAATGKQHYVCDASQGKWLLTGADAPLKDANGMEIGFHYFVDAVPHWKFYADQSFVAVSTVFAIPSPDITADSSGQQPAPAKNIPWLTARKTGGSEQGLLSGANIVARTDTVGGVAPPADTCTGDKHGWTCDVDYQANYYFGA